METMTTGNRVLIEVGLTTEQLVAAVRRMPPAIRRRLLDALARADEAPPRRPNPAPRQPGRGGPRQDDFLAALDAAKGILDISEDPVRWQRRVRSEWDDR